MEFIYLSLSQILAAFAMRHSCKTNGNFNFIWFQLLKFNKARNAKFTMLKVSQKHTDEQRFCCWNAIHS